MRTEGQMDGRTHKGKSKYRPPPPRRLGAQKMFIVLPATERFDWTIPLKPLVQFHQNFRGMISTVSCCALGSLICQLMLHVTQKAFVLE
jgi:hypothetical protein